MEEIRLEALNFEIKFRLTPGQLAVLLARDSEGICPGLPWLKPDKIDGDTGELIAGYSLGFNSVADAINHLQRLAKVLLAANACTLLETNMAKTLKEKMNG